MKKDSLKEKIVQINVLIQALDGQVDKSNNYSFQSMAEHVGEIEELFHSNDGHWIAETVDLLIHCLLLLDRNGCDSITLQKTIDSRCRRFCQKITGQG